MNKLILLPVAIFVAASALSSCSSCQNEEKEGQKVKETITSGVIDISCDESFEPIMEQEIMVFEAAYPKASIIPYYVSESEVLNMLLQDSVRLAIATRPLSPKEEDSFKSRRLKVRTVPLIVRTPGTTFVSSYFPALREQILITAGSAGLIRREIIVWTSDTIWQPPGMGSSP